MKSRSHSRDRDQRRLVARLSLSLAAAGLLTHSATAAVKSAGALLVSVDATQRAVGAVPNIPNTGTLGGFFEAKGDATMIPTNAIVGGTKALVFDGNDFLQLVDAVGGALTVAPAGIVGADPTRSIEVWTLNPVVDGEETLVSWGHRGGGDGSNISFGYGSDFRWGAVGHWGSPDLGWNSDGGNPTPNKWHHLVYTYDGSTTRVYADGKLANAEFLGAGRIDTHVDTAINIAAQLEADGIAVTGGLRYTGAIARVRIHEEVLSDADVLANFNSEKADFIDPTITVTPPVTATRLTKGPVHRYSFSDTAKADATDATFKDSVGKADGVVRGAGSALTGTRLRLDGGPSTDAAYGDLPNGLLSTNGVANGGSGEFTFETWFKHVGNRTWSRVFDFGSSGTDVADLEGPGGGGSGQDYLELSAQIDGDPGNRRLEVRDQEANLTKTADIGTRQFGADVHLVVTWKESTGDINLYENGQRIGGVNTTTKMNEINDVNVWLGRSNWNGDNNTQGEFDEVRLYNAALSAGEILGNFQAGADTLNDRDVAVKIVQQPANASIPQLLNATFTVGAAGSSPVSVQWLRNGEVIPGATNFTYTVTRITDADNGAKFSARVSNSVNGATVNVTSDPATLQVTSDPVVMTHRYSFNEASGTVLKDSVGTADGAIVGGGTLGGGKLTLAGTDGDYGNLPNGLVTELGKNGTFEMWITWDGGPNWQRVFDFGTSNGGEDQSDGGVDYVFLTPKSGDGIPRFQANFPGGGDSTTMSQPGSVPIGVETHIAITYLADANVVTYYTNGVPVATAAGALPLSAMAGQDVNVWLGKSQFADPPFAGSFNEFRFYRGALSATQVAASYAAGPNATPSVAVSLTVTRNANGTLTASWPAAATGLKLAASPVLGAGAVWTVLSDGTPVAADKFQVTLPADLSARFLRLQR